MSSCAICGRPLSWIDDLFSRAVHDTCGKMHGYIGHFKLSERWFSSFDERERQYLELPFMPLGVSIVPATSGRIADQHSLLTGSQGLQVYGRAGSFLANLSGWLNKPESRHLARRVTEQGEAIASDP